MIGPDSGKATDVGTRLDHMSSATLNMSPSGSASPSTAHRPSHRRGDAVLDEGHWKMARSTFYDLMRMAGVECPPVVTKSSW